MSKLLYQTNRSPKTSRKLLTRLILTLMFLSVSIYYGQPSLKVYKSSLFANAFNLFLIIQALGLIVMWFGTRHPFSIYSDHVSVSSLFPIKIPKAENTIEGQAISKKNNQICLIVRNHKTDSVGELRVPWQNIDEPQHEVLQKIDDLILSQTEFF